MRIAYIGNFGPPHSTENHVLTALKSHGHDVWSFQENVPYNWEKLSEMVDESLFDFVLWTRTGWDWASIGLTPAEAEHMQYKMMWIAHKRGIPVVGYHLDIWFGLNREHQLDSEPFFRVDLLVTADGGHQKEFAEKGITHAWLPPAVSLPETELGTYRDDLHSRIAFVGSWQGHYHEESKHRHELVRWLQENYRRDCAFWPRPGEPAVRGSDLRDLYASVDVVVGDSCFVGTGLSNYWSDRIPETLGRGGFLFHPAVPGLSDHFTPEAPIRWSAYDWDDLGKSIDYYLGDPEERFDRSMVGRGHVRKHHTYERRMEQLIELLYKMKLLKKTREPKK